MIEHALRLKLSCAAAATAVAELRAMSGVALVTHLTELHCALKTAGDRPIHMVPPRERVQQEANEFRHLVGLVVLLTRAHDVADEYAALQQLAAAAPCN